MRLGAVCVSALRLTVARPVRSLEESLLGFLLLRKHSLALPVMLLSSELEDHSSVVFVAVFRSEQRLSSSPDRHSSALSLSSEQWREERLVWVPVGTLRKAGRQAGESPCSRLPAPLVPALRPGGVAGAIAPPAVAASVAAVVASPASSTWAPAAGLVIVNAFLEAVEVVGP